MLVVKSVRAGHETHVHASINHVTVVLARHREAPVLLGLLQELGALSADAHELNLVAALGKVRQVRGNRPRAGTDYSEA